MHDNLAYTKFLFITPHVQDDATGGRLRALGALITRGFFNEFDIDSGTPPFETVQFLYQDEIPPPPAVKVEEARHLSSARYVLQASSKYRPRLEELEHELRRRAADADIKSLSGAVRNPRYSSPEMQQYVQKNAAQRRSGRVSRNAIILPIRKNSDWWRLSTLERHAYFYPHIDKTTGCPAKGHACAAEPAIPVLFRRLYYNPDGYERQGEFDFITYFECADDALPIFDRVCTALRDPLQNPEWRFVIEGPLWRGKRVLRW